jgi:hypothetical protein
MKGFVQEGPRLGNQYLEDLALQDLLKAFVGSQLQFYETDLIKFGQRVVSKLLPHAKLCEKFFPTFEKYSAFGEKIDKIHIHPSWHHMHKVSS